MGLKNLYMKTFYGDKYGQIEDIYKNVCISYPSGLEIFLKLRNMKNKEGDFDLKQLISEHEEDIKIYDEYTKNQAKFPNAVMLYTNANSLNVDSASFINANTELMELTETFYKATKNTKPAQYRAFGLTERDRDIVDAELNQRKRLLISYLDTINTEINKDEDDSKPKVEAYTIDAKENRKQFLNSELNGDENVFVIDDTTWQDYINHIVYCVKNHIRIKEDFNLVHKNKYLITRCYQETGYNGGITLSTIYEIKRDSPLKQYVDVCNTAQKFAENEYSAAYTKLVDSGVFKPYNSMLSLIDCLYIVSHVELLKRQQENA